MMNRSTSVAYIDFLFLCFAFFFVISALLMVQSAIKHGDVPDRAEFIAILDWPDGSKSDVDLWMRDPLGHRLFFKSKDVGLMTLDRDDRGMNINTITLDDGSVVADPHRREMASIRGIVPGRYTVNVLMYMKMDDGPVPAHVQVIKLNPYRIVADRTISLEKTTQEETVVSFDVSATGEVSGIDTQTEVSLVK